MKVIDETRCDVSRPAVDCREQAFNAGRPPLHQQQLQGEGEPQGLRPIRSSMEVHPPGVRAYLKADLQRTVTQ